MQLPPEVMVPNPVSVTLGIPLFLYFLQYAVASGGNGTKSCVSDLGIPLFLYFLQYAVASGGNGTKSCVSDFGNSSISLFLTVCSCLRW